MCSRSVFWMCWLKIVFSRKASEENHVVKTPLKNKQIFREKMSWNVKFWSSSTEVDLPPETLQRAIFFGEILILP